MPDTQDCTCQVKNGRIVEIDTLMDKGLPDQIIGRIVEILGSKSGRIYRPKAGVMGFDTPPYHKLFRARKGAH
jgi:hypothetical protein